jgi:hypothetical protein
LEYCGRRKAKQKGRYYRGLSGFTWLRQMKQKLMKLMRKVGTSKSG